MGLLSVFCVRTSQIFVTRSGSNCLSDGGEGCACVLVWSCWAWMLDT